MAESVNIIICYRNRELRRVKLGLESLKAQETRDFRVLFIDYGSEPALAAQAKILCHDFSFCEYHYISTDGQLWNRAAALNHGIRLSQAPWLFTADADLYFLPDFMTCLHQQKQQNQALFFPVGYLDQSDSDNLAMGKTSRAYKKSDEHALGMVLVSRLLIQSVNGYDAFFSLWGLEDNDLKQRIEKVGSTRFFGQVLLLHQYHPPLPLSDQLPEGWVQWMKDYITTDKPARPTLGLDAMRHDQERPAREAVLQRNIPLQKIRARRLFLRALLIAQTEQLPPAGLRAFEIEHQPAPKSSGALSISGMLTGLFRLLKLPLTTQSVYREQYCTKEEIRNEIYFIAQLRSATWRDYYILEKEDRVIFCVAAF